MSIRVLVGEDDYLVRQGVERILATQDDIEIVASCDHYDAMLEALENHQVDVVVTDVRMPPTFTDEGIRFAAHAASVRPEIGVVVLSQYDEPEYVLALLDDGSDRRSYLLKERISDVAHITDAIRTVARGGSLIDSRVVERLVKARSSRRSPMEWLTPRETEVLEAMAGGMSNSAISSHLGIGIRGVEKHISSIFVKLGLSEETVVHRRVQAVLTFLSHVG